MSNQVDGNIKKCRVRKIINMSDEREEEYYKDRCENYVKYSIGVVTALNPYIGYTSE